MVRSSLLFAGGRPLEAEDEEEGVTEAMNNDIDSIQRRIARSLARVHELKADPARLDLDQAARLIGRLTEQRKHAGEGAWRYSRDARRTGRDYRVTGRGPATHRPDRGSGTNRDNTRRSSKGGSEHRPLGARDTPRPDSELARSDQRPDVAIGRPFFCSRRIASSALPALR